MNLILDLGNTAIKASIFDQNKHLDTCKARYQSAEEINLLYSYLEQHPDIQNAIISSVADNGLSWYNYLMEKYILKNIIHLDHHTALPIQNHYESPESLGYDRIAAAVGANNIFPNTTVLVMDIGTAITIDLVSAQNIYIGGNISPGMEMRFKALHAFTDRLPLLSPLNDCLPLGRSTQTAIAAGVQQGIIYELNAYIDEYTQLYDDLKVILTGGNSFFFERYLKNLIFAEPHLVAHGLNCILEYNDKTT